MVKLMDINQRAYAVWVSEIMLQQTQVATVIDYYNKWMKKWPTLQALSTASLEVVNELKGQMPTCAADLMRELPGVGKYTAGAIASIAFGEVTGLVDGNVVRVFSRMRIIGAECSSQPVTEALWSIANCIVDPTRPGDFNQGLMELGATICTPKAPNCSICPVSGLCKAYKETVLYKNRNEVKLLCKTGGPSRESDLLECDIEDCDLCLPASDPWDSSIGVMNYPRKAKKKAPRKEITAVGIVSRMGKGETEYLVTQRPETGLLANLWEFPSAPLIDDTAEKEERLSETLLALGSSAADAKKQFIGEVVHIFSHIHQTYLLYNIKDIGHHDTPEDAKVKWVTKEQFLESAVSTAMKKVFRMYESKTKPPEPAKSKPRSTNRKPRDRKRRSEERTDGRKQMALDGFFKPKAK
ncbi:adenine DNA glycosylase-like isoform X2 [Lineus longissimus]